MIPDRERPVALVNGLESDRLSIADRGFMYGDGLFETIAVRFGRPCLWADHLERLELGARRLGISCPPRELLCEEGRRVVGDSGSCVLKIILTRGEGGRGYRPPAGARPTRVLIRYPASDYPPQWENEGVTIAFCRVPLGENPYFAGIKHLNRLEQVLARSEWDDPAVAEGIMLDGRGRVIGGTMSNLFLVKGRRLVTPRLDTCGITGTIRAMVLRLASDFELEAHEADIGGNDLTRADGLFLTNSLIGVWPVRRLGTVVLDTGRLPHRLIDRVREEAFTPSDWRTG